MVLEFQVTLGYRKYEVYWSGEGNAEMWFFMGGECVSEWQGELYSILETFEEQTGISVTL